MVGEEWSGSSICAGDVVDNDNKPSDSAELGLRGARLIREVDMSSELVLLKSLGVTLFSGDLGGVTTSSSRSGSDRSDRLYSDDIDEIVPDVALPSPLTLPDSSFNPDRFLKFTIRCLRLRPL